MGGGERVVRGSGGLGMRRVLVGGDGGGWGCGFWGELKVVVEVLILENAEGAVLSVLPWVCRRSVG